MMFDVPGWSRRLVPLLSIPDWVDAVLGHFDRVLMLGLFAATGLLATQGGTRPAPVMRHGTALTQPSK